MKVLYQKITKKHNQPSNEMLFFIFYNYHQLLFQNLRPHIYLLHSLFSICSFTGFFVCLFSTPWTAAFSKTQSLLICFLFLHLFWQSYLTLLCQQAFQIIALTSTSLLSSNHNCFILDTLPGMLICHLSVASKLISLCPQLAPLADLISVYGFSLLPLTLPIVLICIPG